MKNIDKNILFFSLMRYAFHINSNMKRLSRSETTSNYLMIRRNRSFLMHANDSVRTSSLLLLIRSIRLLFVHYGLPFQVLFVHY